MTESHERYLNTMLKRLENTESSMELGGTVMPKIITQQASVTSNKDTFLFLHSYVLVIIRTACMSILY